MNHTFRMIAISLLIFPIFTGCASGQQKIFQSVKEKTHAAVIPIKIHFEAVQKWYWDRHDAINERLKQGNVDLLFVGNSITHGWESTGKKYWEQYYAHRNAVNMGFGWDWTQHVLWRLDNAEFDSISPKLAVVMIGTNNSNGNDNTAEEIADGIIAICDRLHTKFPQMKILLLAIFPRGPKPNPQREKCAQASLLASKIADGKMIHYLDLTAKFLSAEGELSREIMPDFLHPNEEGYQIWAEAMEPKLAELLGKEKEKME